MIQTTARFIACADLHLNLNMWTNNKAIVNDSLFSFYNILDLAEQLDIPVVIAGDIFDTKMISSELFRYVSAIRNMFKDVKIYYVNGNHDSVNPSWLSHLHGTVKLGKDPVDINGKQVVGIDYQLVNDFEDALNAVYPFSDVLVTHQTYSCFFNTPASIDCQLLVNRGTVISGDYHKPMSYVLDNNTHIISPGSATKCNIVEAYPRVQLMYDGENYMTFKTVMLPHRCFVYLSEVQPMLHPGYTDTELMDATEKFCMTTWFDSDQLSSVKDLNAKVYEFYDLLRKAGFERDPGLHNVYIATNKEQVDLGNDIVRAVGWGHVLYAPVMIPSVFKDEVDHTEEGCTTDGYLKNMLSVYPVDPAVKAAAVEYIFGNTKDFIANESKRFGVQ